MNIKDLHVDMVVANHKDGTIKPLKFKYEDTLIDVGLIIQSDVERKTGNIIYKCFSIINGFKWHYVLRFERVTCKWYLSSMN